MNQLQPLSNHTQEFPDTSKHDITTVSSEILNRCRLRSPLRQKNRIALIQPRKGTRPAFGFLYLGAYLLDNCFEVKLFEFLDDRFPPNKRYNKGLLKDIQNFSPDFFGIGTISASYRQAQRLIEDIRLSFPDSPIICGGKHPTSNPEDFLYHGADYCCIKEAEITFVELLDAINFKKPIKKIKGIAYLDNGKIKLTEPREPLPIDDILRPAFELVNYKKYNNLRLWSITGQYLKTGFIFGSRGCPYNCKFCVNNNRGAYRARDIDDLISEIEWQMNKFRLNAFVIMDDLFYFNEQKTKEFLNKIIEKGIKVKLYMHVRADRGTKETIELMKKAGVIQVAAGVESGSQKILNAMGKASKIEKIIETFKVYNEVGINTLTHFIIGHPEEDEADREATKRLIHKICPTFVCANYYVPMPGSPGYDFDIKNAKYLLGGKDFKEFSYTLDNPEFSTTVPLAELKKIGNELQRLSGKNRNLNLFTYPSFYLFVIKFLILHPLILLEALYLRYISHKTHQLTFFSLLKEVVEFASLRFKNKRIKAKYTTHSNHNKF